MADKLPIQPPVTNPSPKERFLQGTGNISSHRDMMASAPFEKGTDMALLQFIHEQTARVRNTESAMEAGYKIAGAVDYLKTLKTISEKLVIVQTRPNDNLPQPK